MGLLTTIQTGRDLITIEASGEVSGEDLLGLFAEVIALIPSARHHNVIVVVPPSVQLSSEITPKRIAAFADDLGMMLRTGGQTASILILAERDQHFAMGRVYSAHAAFSGVLSVAVTRSAQDAEAWVRQLGLTVDVLPEPARPPQSDPFLPLSQP